VTSWLEGVRVIEAPSDHGPDTLTPQGIVVHAMGEFIKTDPPQHAVKYLESAGLSAHVLTCPNGDLIHCREDWFGAWHAKGFNDKYLGIEIFVPGEHDYGSFLKAIKTDWCPDAAFWSSVRQCLEWKRIHGPLPIFRHSDIDPSRKYDPGSGFQWDAFVDAYTEERVL
jgi:N-acetyl-anhydromuramyl-L-alanine amidase AmpD